MGRWGGVVLTETEADASSCSARLFVNSARVHDGGLFVGGGTWKGVARVHGVTVDPDSGFVLQLPLRDQ